MVCPFCVGEVWTCSSRQSASACLMFAATEMPVFMLYCSKSVCPSITVLGAVKDMVVRVMRMMSLIWLPYIYK